MLSAEKYCEFLITYSGQNRAKSVRKNLTFQHSNELNQNSGVSRYIPICCYAHSLLLLVFSLNFLPIMSKHCRLFESPLWITNGKPSLILLCYYATIALFPLRNITLKPMLYNRWIFCTTFSIILTNDFTSNVQYFQLKKNTVLLLAILSCIAI